MNNRQRLHVVAVVGISLFAALLTRLWYLQVLNSEEYRTAATRNQVRVVRVPPVRGRLLDRNGRVLVANRPSNIVTVDRSTLPVGRRTAVLRRLSTLSGTDMATLQRRFEDKRIAPFAPVPVLEDVPENVVTRIRERADQFPGVTVDISALRTYPNGAVGAHVLGYVGQVNDDDIRRNGDSYEPGDQIGKAGAEQTFERELRGRVGRTEMEVDAKGRAMGVLRRVAPRPGNDIVLSIDLDVQRLAEQSLDEGLRAARGRPYGDTNKKLVADAGAVVVLDLKAGTVLAMASNPTFDPNVLANGVDQDEAKALFSADTGAPFTNRAIQGQYAPGSTWKLVTAAAALEHRLVSPGTVVNDPGFFIIPECVGKCRFQNAGGARNGPVDLRRAITVSSDVYFYRLGADFWVRRESFGEDAIQRVARRFGLGTQTGVPLPSEVSGRVPTPASRAAAHEANPKAFVTGKWFAGDNVNLAIGQGEIAMTPIQLASLYATFATGVRYSPNIATEVRAPDGTVRTRIQPRVAERVDVPDTVRRPIMDGLMGVTRDPKGTAAAAFSGFPLDRFPVAGKTGTAQAMPKQDTALFVAVAPAEDPQYAVAVVMEQSGFGATAAAPVARRVLGLVSGLEPPTPVTLAAGGPG